MKRLHSALGVALVALLLSYVPVGAAAAYVNQWHNDSTGSAISTTVATTSPASPVAGNYLTVFVGIDGTTPPAVSTITDTALDTFTFRTSVTGTQNAQNCEMWTASSIGSGNVAVVVTMASSIRHNVAIMEVSGATIGATATATGANTAGTVTVSGSSFTSSGFSTSYAGSATAVTGTIRVNQYVNNQGNVVVTAMTAPGTTTAFTYGGTANWAACAIKLDSAAASVTPRLMLLGIGP